MTKVDAQMRNLTRYSAGTQIAVIDKSHIFYGTVMQVDRDIVTVQWQNSICSKYLVSTLDGIDNLIVLCNQGIW